MTYKITGINLSPQEIQKLKSCVNELPKVTPEQIKKGDLALKAIKGPTRDEFVRTLKKPIGDFKKDLMPIKTIKPVKSNWVVNTLKKLIRLF